MRDLAIGLLATCTGRLSTKLSTEMALEMAPFSPSQHSIRAYSQLPEIYNGSNDARCVNARNATGMPCAMQSRNHYHMFTPSIQSRKILHTQCSLRSDALRNG